jgi:ABC-type transporter Mla subunit MlaD
MTDEAERIVKQSQDLIGALRRDRDDLVDQIQKSQETIASSQQLIKRLNEVLAKAENPKPSGSAPCS